MATRDSWPTRPMPDKNVKLPMELRLTDGQMRDILYGHIPAAMEDRWFMYCGDNKIRYFRSWSGICIYEADFAEVLGGYEITALTVNQDPAEYHENPEKAKALFCALLMQECGGDAEPYWNEYVNWK